MNDLDRTMLLIKSIDTGAHLDFSDYTRQWFVASGISIGGDGLLVSPTEHRPDPEAAVHAFMAVLTDVNPDHYLVTDRPNLRHWRWNGAAFVELPYTYPEWAAS